MQVHVYHLEVYNDAFLPPILVAIKYTADLQCVRRQLPRPELLQIIPGYWKQTPSVLGIPLACSSAISPAPRLDLLKFMLCSADFDMRCTATGWLLLESMFERATHVMMTSPVFFMTVMLVASSCGVSCSKQLLYNAASMAWMAFKALGRMPCIIKRHCQFKA